jgi:hypothetical protein
MSIEYLLVTYPDERAVLADGEEIGLTNHVLLLPADEYAITLAGDGYAPASQDVVLSDTSEAKPMVIPFTPVAAGVTPAASATGSSTEPITGTKTKDA